MKTFKPTLENVKYLGRTLYLDDSLWLAPSASGVEFIFQGTELAVTILGGDYTVTGTKQVRIAVYVDESRALKLEFIGDSITCGYGVYVLLLLIVRESVPALEHPACRHI